MKSETLKETEERVVFCENPGLETVWSSNIAMPSPSICKQIKDIKIFYIN